MLIHSEISGTVFENMLVSARNCHRGVRRSGRESDNSHPFSAEVKNGENSLLNPYAFVACKGQFCVNRTSLETNTNCKEHNVCSITCIRENLSFVYKPPNAHL